MKSNVVVESKVELEKLRKIAIVKKIKKNYKVVNLTLKNKLR